ncbi:prenyltransferase [Motiliproteus coralliicola]|uniref:Prenyltransferase n=1 Tax=Motiliproteus coralliicola TaxID=2283196 RepID=A0A369WPH9_9GAMM|nr:prenyltransferase [Motiliproteus coralliicola]RDE22524.1 prenyltransferase [Motiliproteus coralliicola]
MDISRDQTELVAPRLLQSLRPFSLVVALVSCGLGVALALLEGYGSGWRALLILLAGLALQAGVNLINDLGDLPLLQDARFAERRRGIHRHARLGYGCFVFCSLIGFWLVADVGLSLLGLCILGAIGALGYSVEPIHYKRRGLGVPLVFWLMGVLMVLGASHAMGAPLTLSQLWLSLPISALISLLLLSNELRDWELDHQRGVKTLTVRLGYAPGQKLYLALLAGTYLLTLALWQQQLLLRLWPLLPSLLLLPALLKLLDAEPQSRRALTPASGRLLLIFGLLYLGCLLPF